MRWSIDIRCTILAAGFVAILATMQVSAAALFEQTAVLDVELSGPLTTIFDRAPERMSLPFTLRADGAELEIEVRLRGKSRLRVCRFPPLRLDFSKSATAGTVFEGQRRLRLVTHCRNRDSSEQDLLLEYAAYRVFNLLSEVGYRVRLLRIRYSDSDGRLDENARERYGFLIESTEGLTERTGATPLDLPGVTRSSLDPEQAALVYVFQYLIGNTDWSIVTALEERFCCHNVNLYEIDSAIQLVPYDFDLAGLVNAPYAKPDPSARISRVTQRLYRGYCTQRAALQAALQHVVDHRAEILGVPTAVPGLMPKDTTTATRYLEKFFARAGDRQKLLKRFESRCL